MSGFMLAGAMIVLTMFMMMARTDLLKWLGYANLVDVAFTIIMLLLFHNTYGGVVAASFAGVFMSGSLWALRNYLGCKRLHIKYKGYGVFVLEWYYISGAEIRADRATRKQAHEH